MPEKQDRLTGTKGQVVGFDSEGNAVAKDKNTPSSRITVGTSTAGWGLDDCDFLCSGQDDPDVIYAAFKASYHEPSGDAQPFCQEVYFLPGALFFGIRL